MLSVCGMTYGTARGQGRALQVVTRGYNGMESWNKLFDSGKRHPKLLVIL